MQFDIRSFLESGRKPFEAHFEVISPRRISGVTA